MQVKMFKGAFSWFLDSSIGSIQDQHHSLVLGTLGPLAQAAQLTCVQAESKWQKNDNLVCKQHNKRDPVSPSSDEVAKNNGSTRPSPKCQASMRNVIKFPNPFNPMGTLPEITFLTICVCLYFFIWIGMYCMAYFGIYGISLSHVTKCTYW